MTDTEASDGQDFKCISCESPLLAATRVSTLLFELFHQLGPRLHDNNFGENAKP